MSSPAYGNASGASPFADAAFGSDSTASQGCSQRSMSVKVIYTLNDKDQSPCLHRLPQPQPVMVVALEDGNQLGMVDLRVCVEEVLKASPELLPKLKEYDHAVYAYDYSEEDIPTVGQGKLSTILNQDGMGEESAQIVGRIMKNPMAVFKKQSAETLEVKLKFVALPSDSPLKKKPQRPQLLESSSGTSSFAARMQAAYDRPNASSPRVPMTSSPAYMPDDLRNYHQDSPSSMTPQEIDLFLNSPIVSPGTTGAGLGSDPIDPDNNTARPPSRMSVHESTQAANAGFGDAREIMENDDGPAKKRARLEQVSRPRSGAFGAQPRDASLRRTASTTASIRNFRPILPGSTQAALGHDTDGANRAPTPRPQRTRNVGLRRASTMSTISTLRQESSVEETNISSSSPSRSPDKPSPTFTSSPPLSNFEVYDETRADDSTFLSSPLPPYEPIDGSGFTLEEFDMTFSELPDMPETDFDAHIDIHLDSGLAHDSGIGLMSEEPETMLQPKELDTAGSLSATGPADYVEQSQQSNKTTKSAQSAKPARRPTASRPNQKTQASFPPGEHPLYQQRTTKIAWNSYSPQGGPALYVQTPQPAISSQNKARNALKLPRIPDQRSDASASSSTTPAAGPNSGSQAAQQHASQASERRPGSSPTSSVAPSRDSPAPSYFALPAHSQQQTTSASIAVDAVVSTTSALAAPTSSEATSPSGRQRPPLGDISGNATTQAVSHANTPRPTTAMAGEDAQTPGSKAGAKRKRTGSKAPAKSTKDTPSGRTEKRPKRGPRPLVDEDGNRIHCYTCGAIESATWRSLYLKIVPGPDSPVQYTEGVDKVAVHPNVDPAGNVMLDAQGKVKEWMIFRKSVGSQEQQAGEWTVFKQCNACGVHFNQHGQLRIPDWAKLLDAGGAQQQAGSAPGLPLCRSLAKASEDRRATNIDLTACDENRRGDSAQDSLDHLFHETESLEHETQAATSGKQKDGADTAVLDASSEEDKENTPPDQPVPSSVFGDFGGMDGSMLGDHTDFEYLWGRGFDELVWNGDTGVQDSHDHAPLDPALSS